jgi:hypothetical protein
MTCNDNAAHRTLLNFVHLSTFVMLLQIRITIHQEDSFHGDNILTHP